MCPYGPKVIFLLIKTYFSEYLRPERSPAVRRCACFDNVSCCPIPWPVTVMASVEELSECRPKFWSMVTEDVVKRCAAFLTQVNDIPRLYRRTNKEVSGSSEEHMIKHC